MYLKIICRKYFCNDYVSSLAKYTNTRLTSQLNWQGTNLKHWILYTMHLIALNLMQLKMGNGGQKGKYFSAILLFVVTQWIP